MNLGIIYRILLPVAVDRDGKRATWVITLQEKGDEGTRVLELVFVKDVKMAEGGAHNVLCRYFINGACREGEQCHFAHNRDAARPSVLCRYYLRGNCFYGRNCRYDHTRPNHSNQSNCTQQEDSPSDSPCPESIHSGNFDARHRDGIEETKKQSSQPNIRLPSGPAASTGRESLCISNNSNLPSFRSRQKSLEKSCEESPASSWVDAPEFVPRLAKDNTKQYDVSYAQVAGAGDKDSSTDSNGGIGSSDSELCPTYLMSGRCHLGDSCSYIHGLLCEVCQLACLHPYDKEQRRIHKEECTKLMEAEMEHSFAVARSRDKVCGICMDTIMERPLASQRRFGILPNCAHCFCLNCIRKWRSSKQFENKIVRSCPECRVQSDFVIPSRYWVDDKDKEEKEKLLKSYRNALSDKPCKYFKQGEGQCPFGNKCFYLHALPDGTKKDVGPPRRRRRFNAEGELQLYLDNMVLWDFIEEREHRLELLRGSIQTLLLELELEDLADEFYFADDSVSEASDL
ncbi:E3 ubiquitin-protein ligase makorin-2 [Panulirus ornatus]|uniref:E3 ubiquitin-protein ligase makorin-2 n=1 Tax=Panulirus ornatus TaxID=150431 RepID=UPI003A87810E